MFASLVRAIAETPDTRQEIGAISLLGDEQAGLIRRSGVGLAEPIELRVAGSLPATQPSFRATNGRRVFSMVDRRRATPRPRAKPVFKQRFNVAASRAKDQLWLVHSLDPNRDLQPTDLRRRLIEHVRDPGAWRRAAEDATARTESPFERRVIEVLLAAGFDVKPQVEVGRYQIDMVVSDGAQQVALECDGDRYHPAEQIPDDLARQAVLERAGWRFIRMRGTRFFREPDATMRDVIDELRRLGVHASVGPRGALAGPSIEEHDFREIVVRRAAEIIRQQGWAERVPTDTAVL